MASFDFIAEKNAKEAQLAFVGKFIDAKQDIISFVGSRLKWSKAGEFIGFLKGSFNASVVVRNSETNERVLIRFPFPGKVYGPWRDEKVKNEVMALKYISRHTSIPVPRVYDWGLAEESPQQLGAFMIEEFMEGGNLGDLLKKPTEDETDPAILDPNIDEAKLNVVYEQIASFMLELSRLEFPRIGAISQDTVSGNWTVAGPPLTYDMNEVVAFAGFPADHFKTMASFDRGSDYFAARATHLQIHLETQRNIGWEDEDITWNRYVARECFARLIPTYGMVDDSGPFRLFCDDLRPSNMLVDPQTMHITAVLDWEFTNVMPAQFAYDLPWWLILGNPAILISEGSEALQEFLGLFEPRKEQFIRAMERIETRLQLPAEELHLSARMRDSWNSKRFWFNLASQNSFDVDEIYWRVLHKEGLGEAMLDMATLAEKDGFLKRKKKQFETYFAEKQNDDRFN
ncbi:kinase-like domain-containing protein [Hypoxylon sp. FL1857]|nr:kinase-like domain-containing protein [Hypoxylon sp. FL1857]